MKLKTQSKQSAASFTWEICESVEEWALYDVRRQEAGVIRPRLMSINQWMSIKMLTRKHFTRSLCCLVFVVCDVFPHVDRWYEHHKYWSFILFLSHFVFFREFEEYTLCQTEQLRSLARRYLFKLKQHFSHVRPDFFSWYHIFFNVKLFIYILLSLSSPSRLIPFFWWLSMNCEWNAVLFTLPFHFTHH